MVGGDAAGDLETFAKDIKADIAILDGLQRIHFTGALDEALVSPQRNFRVNFIPRP